MVVELKWNKSADGAIQQIKDRKYVKALEHHAGEILLIGINYDKKTKKHECIIEKSKNDYKTPMPHTFGTTINIFSMGVS